MERGARDIPSHKLIMLIDDSTIDNFVNQKIIEKYKFSEEVVTFTKAAEALKYLSDIDEKQDNPSKIPAFIFLDLNMPLVNGFQFLEIFDKLSPYIKLNSQIIILTSSANPSDIIQTDINKNVLTFLQKPLLKINLDEIEAILKQKSKLIVK
jgi:CheY-like chemotaxis protein